MTTSAFALALRELRTKEGLTQAELSDLARVSRRTLIRWESGEVSPWLPELRAVLASIAATPEQVDGVIATLTSPRAERATGRAAIRPLGLYIRAFRLRGDLAAREVAERLGCDVATVFRWERDAVRPPTDALVRLWSILEPDPLEVEALQSCSVLETEFDEASIEEEREGIGWPWDPLGWVLSDVRWLDLLRRLQTYSLANDAVRWQLLRARVGYAEVLLLQRRQVEAEEQSRAALELSESDTDFPAEIVHGANVLRARINCLGRPRKSALQILDELELRPLNLENYALRRIAYAEFYLAQGNQAAARLHAEAAVEAIRSRKPSILAKVGCLAARILLDCGDPGAALALLPPVFDESPYDIAWNADLRSQVLRKLGRNEEATHWQTLREEQVVAYRLPRQLFARQSGASDRT